MPLPRQLLRGHVCRATQQPTTQQPTTQQPTTQQHTTQRRTTQRRRPSFFGPSFFRLGHEPLEDRRVLSAVTVTNNLDLVNGDTSSIAALLADDGGDGIALREAIEAANNTLGADEIAFDFGHDGPETILLGLGELEITDDVTITGDGPDLLTIDASASDPTPELDNGDGSSVFQIDDGDLTKDFLVEIS
ncbi:MAG: hypothetical protein KDA63_01455, partial [Planctomycetales bacterium]|nr:hypothetical protein [Planctomycetales bacterium]